MHPATQAMAGVAIITGWPTHYRSDLRIDALRLEGVYGQAPETFLWSLRESGSNIVSLTGPGVDVSRGNSPIALFWAITSSFFGPQRWYLWDGSSLALASATRAERLARDATDAAMSALVAPRIVRAVAG